MKVSSEPTYVNNRSTSMPGVHIPSGTLTMLPLASRLLSRYVVATVPFLKPLPHTVMGVSRWSAVSLICSVKGVVNVAITPVVSLLVLMVKS